MSRISQRRAVAVVILLLCLVAGACGKDKSVGSEKVLDFEEQKENRLGTEASTTQPPSAQPAGSPTTAPANATTTPTTQRAAAPTTTAPRAAESFFDVTLIDRHPYYEPGDQIVVTVGTTLRVTNKDTTAERPQRSFTAADGSFDSGMLKVGQVWTYKLSTPGSWRIVDRSAPFISAQLDVR